MIEANMQKISMARVLATNKPSQIKYKMASIAPPKLIQSPRTTGISPGTEGKQNMQIS